MRIRTSLLVGLAVCLVIPPGCKKKSASGSSPSAATSTDSASNTEVETVAFKTRRSWDPSAGTATISGVVKFQGDSPRRRPIDMGGKPKCSEQHKEKLLDESVVVNSNKTLRNVFVRISKGLESWKFAAPTEPISLDQKGCRYSPHVFGVQVGQPVKIRNGDPLLHNIHSFSQRNRGFNFAQTSLGSETTKVFKNPEMVVKIKCDVHGWMASYAGVVANPFFAVTGEKGAFSLEGLPPGDYTVEAWHEIYGTKSQDVTVGDKESKTIEFTFEDK